MNPDDYNLTRSPSLMSLTSSASSAFWVKLDVRDKEFQVSRKSLKREPDSLLARIADNDDQQLFEDNDRLFYDQDAGKWQIDGDPEYFPYIQKYLRTGQFNNVNQHQNFQDLMDEAEYYGLEGLVEICKHKLSEKTPERPMSRVEKSVSPCFEEKEKLAVDLRELLFFMPRNQRALQDQEKVTRHREAEDQINGGCVTPISTKAAVTYAHGSHSNLKEFNEGEENEHSIVNIKNCENQTIQHQMKVIRKDEHHDFILLYSVNGREIFKDFPNLRPPKEFEWFLGFGLSHSTHRGQHITYRTGRICSILPNHKGRYLASSSIDAGDSGGPCYSANRYLIGIMVSSTTTDPRLESVYDRENVEEEIQDAAANPADTWITPSSLISEAYDKYLVDQGILQVPAEIELGQPKRKRQKNQ